MSRTCLPDVTWNKQQQQQTFLKIHLLVLILSNDVWFLLCCFFIFFFQNCVLQRQEMKQSYLILCSFMVAIAISSVSSRTTKYRKLIHEKCWPIRYKCKHLGQNPARWSEYDGGCRRWYVFVSFHILSFHNISVWNLTPSNLYLYSKIEV